ncbi:MAG: hypothetical protein FWF29_04915 [Treponema sp.]|nr:hypothetical protein [Treponema sp.]
MKEKSPRGASEKINRTGRALRIISLIVSITAIVQLALSQTVIRITRLSAAETTGISFFAFILFGLVALFAVTRMKDSAGGKIFAFAVNIAACCAGFVYLRLLFSDDVFFRNLFYLLDRKTQVYQLLPLNQRISRSVPLALVISGMAVYLFCGLFILAASFVPSGTGQNREERNRGRRSRNKSGEGQ